MPRYVVERTFPEGLNLPRSGEGALLCRAVVENNAEEGVTWIHSYVSEDKVKTFCVYDAPTPSRWTGSPSSASSTLTSTCSRRVPRPRARATGGAAWVPPRTAPTPRHP
jgi:hypothetical protein